MFTSCARLRILLLCCALPACGDTHDGASDPGTGEGDDGSGESQATGEPTGGATDASGGPTSSAGEPTSGGSSSGASGSPTSAGSTGSTGDTEVDIVTILNGSFELTSLEPGCHSDLSNDEFTMAVESVTAFGDLDQTDLYSDGCYGENSDGLFHVGLGAEGSGSDAIALELSAPLNQGHGSGYRLRFFASHGETGGITSTNVLIGVSSQPTQFGTLIGETGQLGNVPVEYELLITNIGSTHITVQVEPDGDLGWAMIDAFQLEPVE